MDETSCLLLSMHACTYMARPDNNDMQMIWTLFTIDTSLMTQVYDTSLTMCYAVVFV